MSSEFDGSVVAVSVLLQFYILAMGNIVTKELLLSQVTRESFIEARIRGKSYCHQNERKSLHTLYKEISASDPCEQRP